MTPRLLRPLACLVLALTLLPRGPGLWEGLLGALLLGLGALSWRRPRAPLAPPPALEKALVLLALLALGTAACTTLGPWDQSLGVDRVRHLQDAVSLYRGDLEAFNPWRRPLWPFLTGQLGGLLGALLPASQLLALASVLGSLGLTWWLGRKLVGPLAALGALGLLAGSPDLLFSARFSTPYPLLGLLVTAAVACAGAGLLSSSRRGLLWGPALGLTLGGLAQTDARGGVLGACVVAGLALAAGLDPERRRKGLAVAALGATLGALVALGLGRVWPVETLPLAELADLQRGLHVTTGPRSCLGLDPHLPRLVELGAPCGRDTVADNLFRADRALPVALSFLGALAGLGLLVRGPRPRRWLWLLLLPLLSALPAFAVLTVHHRYLLPLLPLAALLVGRGLAWLAEGSGRPGAALALGLVGVLAVGAQRSPDTPLARGRAGGMGVVPVGRTTGELLTTRELRGQLLEGDRVVDCARLGMDAQLFPARVRTLSPKVATCKDLLAWGPDEPAVRTWLLIRKQGSRKTWSGWEQQLVFPGGAKGPRTVALRGTR